MKRKVKQDEGDASITEWWKKKKKAGPPKEGQVNQGR